MRPHAGFRRREQHHGAAGPNVAERLGNDIRQSGTDDDKIRKLDFIADGVVITPEGKPPNLDAENYFIRDGIVVVPKNAVIPAGFWI